VTTVARQHSLHEEFEKVSARYPERLAVVDDRASLTYRDLDLRADQVAQALVDSGVRGGLVGLGAARSVDVVVGVLAILKAGAGYVPIDPDLPGERRRHTAAEVAVMLVDRPGVSYGDVPVVVIDAVPTTGPGLSRSGRAAGDVAYVIHTSGSTGLPKGVVAEHRQVLSLFDAADEVFEFGPTDTWTLFHSTSFDFSVWEMFGALLYGGCLVIVSQETTRSPEDLWRLIRNEGVTVLNLTPSYFTQLARADRGHGHGLRYVILGGEKLEFARLRDWYERYGDNGPQLVNMYGITETTVHVTYRKLSARDVTESRSIIGRPLPHLTVRLLDENLCDVPEGEICVSGSGVTRGYLGRPDLTADRFVQGLYRSGDLGRFLDNGEIEYLGRSDDQVKVRGYRIELGEITHRLRQHPRLADVAVTMRGEQLVAYVVARPGEPVPTAEELRAYVASSLPGYMVPGWFVPLPRLPLNHNQKLDMAALPEPGGQSEVEPADQVMLSIWREVLGAGSVTSTDRFYAVGGDSIRAIQIVAAARDAGIHIRIDDLLDNPSVATLACRTASPAPATSADLLSPEDRARLPETVEDAYPATALQLGMLFHSDTDALYHSVSTATVNRAFDRARMTRCLHNLVQRHETLRSWFDVTGFSVPLCLVGKSGEVRLTVTDLSNRDTAAQRAAVAVVVDQERGQPLDWRQAPLIRFRVVILRPDAFLFIWSEHHAILDGWSSNSLFAELVAEYVDDVGHPTPPSIRDYVAAELAAVNSLAEKEFWATYLRGLPSAPAAVGDTIELTVDVPPGTRERLVDVANNLAVPLRTVVTAVIAAALGAHRRTNEVVVGHVSHGRLDRDGDERTLGLFLNPLPLRVAVGGSWRDIVAAVDTAVRLTTPHRMYPFAEIQRTTGFRLDNLVNFTDFHQLSPLVDSGIVAEVTNHVRTNLPLVIEVDSGPTGAELVVHVQFGSPEWTATARDRFALSIGKLLRQASDDVDAHPVGLAAPAMTVLDDIVAYANKNPDAPAVSDGTTTLSYQQLVQRTRALAELLHTRGVDIVAMCLPRTVDLVVTSLAVFWAGATLVPIEPGHPVERQRYMLTDTGATLVIGADVPGPTPVLSVTDLDWAALPDHDFAPRCTARDLAYVLYTSGSTGVPKGVAVTHANLRAIMSGVVCTLGMNESDVVLGWSPMTFDPVFVEHIATMMAGGRLELLTDAELSEPARVRARCVDTGVTFVQATPTKTRILADVGMPPVRTVLTVGEPLPPTLAEELRRGGATVWNGYGPTEITVYATMHRVDDRSHRNTVPIGVPLPGVVVRVVDESGQDVPVGTEGELWIGGVGVALGYFRHPELTEPVYVDGFYRSGDLGYVNDRGELEFRGRADTQVKINGVRVEITEIEHQLATHPAVAGAAVVLAPDSSVLTAYVVPGETAVDPAELRDHLADRVPAVMVPTGWLFLGRLPLTASGKIDRKQLSGTVRAPSPVGHGPALAGADQRLVAEVWEAVLGRAPSRAGDRFGELGGDSLAAMRAVGWYARAGITVRAAELMANGTVVAQATLIGRLRATNVDEEATV
jgi:amino acid adenylation domain-containing protein